MRHIIFALTVLIVLACLPAQAVSENCSSTTQCILLAPNCLSQFECDYFGGSERTPGRSCTGVAWFDSPINGLTTRFSWVEDPPLLGPSLAECSTVCAHWQSLPDCGGFGDNPESPGDAIHHDAPVFGGDGGTGLGSCAKNFCIPRRAGQLPGLFIDAELDIVAIVETLEEYGERESRSVVEVLRLWGYDVADVFRSPADLLEAGLDSSYQLVVALRDGRFLAVSRELVGSPKWASCEEFFDRFGRGPDVCLDGVTHEWIHRIHVLVDGAWSPAVSDFAAEFGELWPELGPRLSNTCFEFDAR